MKNECEKIIASYTEEICDADKRATNKEIKLFADTITIELIENAMKVVK